MQSSKIIFGIAVLSVLFCTIIGHAAFAEKPPLKGSAKDFLAWCQNPKEDCRGLLVMHRTTYSEFGKGKEGLPQICLPDPIAGDELKSTVISELTNDATLQNTGTTPALLHIYEKHYPCK